MVKRTATSPQAALSPRFARQHGAAWFDMDPGNVDLNKAGIWVSQGGEAFQRVHGVGELDPRVVWWTNLSLPQTWMAGRWGELKDTHFLGPSWADLLTETGEQADGPVIERWSETFARLAEWFSEITRVLQPEHPWEWGEGHLADVLAQRWGWYTPADQAPRPQPVLAAAHVTKVTHVPLGGPRQWAGRRQVALSLPRVPHALKIWESRVPAGDWNLLEAGQWPSLLDERLRWLKALRQPALVRVDRIEWHHGQEELGRTWVGLRGRRYPAALPEPIWMTGDEAVELSQWARFELESAYLADRWEYGSAPEWWQGELNDHPLAVHSLMMGLAAHTLWQAGAVPARDPVNRAKSALAPAMVWKCAADRHLCFEAARRLVVQGLPVMTHGEGQVTVAVDPGMPIQDLADQVKKAGLLLPKALAQALPLPAEADPDNPLDVAHWLARVGTPQTLWDLDRVVAPWLGPGAEVSQLLTEASKNLALLDASAVPQINRWWRATLPLQLRQATQRLKQAAQRRGRVTA